MECAFTLAAETDKSGGRETVGLKGLVSDVQALPSDGTSTIPGCGSLIFQAQQEENEAAAKRTRVLTEPRRSDRINGGGQRVLRRGT